jgi:hypothetical protein
VLCGLDGEKAEALSTPCTIPSVDFEWCSDFLCGINDEVLNHSPWYFNLQWVGKEISFPRQ